VYIHPPIHPYTLKRKAKKSDLIEALADGIFKTTVDEVSLIGTLSNDVMGL
jgi:hypothetical protein